MATETDIEFEGRMLTQFRNVLEQKGISREQIHHALRVAFIPGEIAINTEADYERAADLHWILRKEISLLEWGTARAARLHALGGEMIRFEDEFQKLYGRLPGAK